MDSLKKRRGAARVNFTKTANLIKEELKKDASDKGIVRVKLIKLQEYLSELKDYVDKIITLLADSAANEDALSAEMGSCDKYHDEFHVLTGIMYEQLEKNTSRTGSISTDDSVSSVTVKGLSTNDVTLFFNIFDPPPPLVTCNAILHKHILAVQKQSTTL
ncbi:hypothetical protein AVEN_101600-1 [Araneus ventricosus]|uniref:Uncharacterized protein n=1 Tax=Araneus ventricosus TaxID=182803 RepID=A0A4Y2BK27_ARAVE|nr:hypothetical protein AVEN_101600-1 [Araneus ventricosus]